MPFNTTADPEQIEILTSVLDRYCHNRGIGPGPERTSAAELVMALFTAGARTTVQLESRLPASPDLATTIHDRPAIGARSD